jgi:protein tyrosine kinase modulator
MLQAFSSSQPAVYEEREQGLDVARYLAIAKKRIFYFAIPFVFLLILGCLIVAIQRPIYQAQGKILVESPEIPATLVQPTVTAAAAERMQVIQQRIMTRENLLSIIKKFGLFQSQQTWMSGTQLIDLMKERISIELVDVDALNPKSRQSTNSAVAFTIGFEYENPELAMKVANEILTLVLNEDVRGRTSRATETTQFLAREVKRLQEELDKLDTQLGEAKRQSAQQTDDAADPLKARMVALNAMKTDLLAKSSVYSEAHPALKSLRKRIAALEREISGMTKASPASSQGSPEQVIEQLNDRQTYLQNALDDASKKLSAARLGESMELGQQAEHLQVIEQPALPQKPIKPKRLKLLAMTFALATLVGAGSVFGIETLDKSIRGTRDLTSLVDSHLLVAIPYITTAGETARRKRRIILLWVLLAIILVAGIAGALYVGIGIDSSLFDRSWMDSLTRLSK